MTEAQNIVIQLDENVIKEQIRSVVQDELGELAFRLRMAADNLDGFQFRNNQEEWFKEERKREYERGVQDGLAKKSEPMVG